MARQGQAERRKLREAARRSQRAEEQGNPAGVTFASGAKRSQTKPRYDLIPSIFLKRLAARFEMGLRYGEHNYKRGLPFDDTFNHIIDHLQSYRDRRKQFLEEVDHGARLLDTDLAAYMKNTEKDGDDIAAAAWGLAAICFLEDTGRLL